MPAATIASDIASGVALNTIETQCPAHIKSHHWENMTATRGLDPAWVAANARSVTAEEATELLGYKAKSGGIWLEGSGYQGQFKPDKPWRSDEEKNKKAPKYRTPAGSGYDSVLPKHPEDLNYWDRLQALKEKAFKIDGHPCLVVTEGVFTAIAPMSAGIPTIALLGVSMGLTSSKEDPQGKRYLVPELERLARAGFGFIIGFDADAATKKEVGWEQLKLISQLKLFDVPVYSITGHWKVEQGKGIDDYIQANGGSRFIREVMGKAVDISVWERQFKGSSEQKRKQKPPTAREIGLEIAEKYKDRWAFHNEQKTWRTFDGRIWQVEEDEAFGQMVFIEIEARGIEYSSDRYVENAIKTIRRQLLVRKWKQWDRRRYIPFNNGILDIETRELIRHYPGMRLTSCLKWNYNPLQLSGADFVGYLARHCPQTHSFMASATKGDRSSIEKMLAVVNATLKWRWVKDFQMFLHLQGDPGTGKGTFARLLEKIVGKENSKGSTGKMLSDQNEMAAIIDKQLVILPDERKPSGNIGPILSLTGGDPITYREIYKKAASGTFGGLLLISSNNPIFSGDFVGIDRRHCSIHFNNRVPKVRRNSKIEELMEKEIGTLIAIALSMPEERVADLIRGIGDGDIPAFRQQLWILKVEENSIAEWLNERAIYDPNARTRIGVGEDPNTLYGDYVKYVKATGCKPSFLKSFYPTIRELCYEHLSYFGWEGIERGRLAEGANKGERVIYCLRLREPEDEQPFLDEAIFASRGKEGKNNIVSLQTAIAASNPEMSYDELTARERSRFDKTLNSTNELMSRLGWSQERGRQYLRGGYSVGSRTCLTLDALLEFESFLLEQVRSEFSEPAAEIAPAIDWSSFPYTFVEYYGKNHKREVHYPPKTCENKAREIRNAIVKNKGIKGLATRFDSAQIAWVVKHFSNQDLEAALLLEKQHQTSLFIKESESI